MIVNNSLSVSLVNTLFAALIRQTVLILYTLSDTKLQESMNCKSHADFCLFINLEPKDWFLLPPHCVLRWKDKERTENSDRLTTKW